MRAHCAIGALLALANAAAPVVTHADAGTLSTGDSIRRTLESRFPGIAIIDVKASPLPGLFEVFTGDAIAYVDASADHMLVGSLLDTATRRDLTAQRVTERNSVEFDSLPFEQAIRVVKGNGARRLAVFADPDCPYCRRLEAELEALTDVTIYTFLFPIAELHPEAVARSRAIWCAPDRALAWTGWMRDRTSAPHAATCEADPVATLHALGRSLHITGTPTMFLADGRRLTGALAAADLDRLLSEASTRAIHPGAEGR